MGSFAGRIESGSNTSHRQADNGQNRSFRNQSRRIKAGWTIVTAKKGHESAGQPHADESADQRQQNALGEKLHHDTAVGGAQSFAQSNFTSPLGNRNQHNVNDADPP